MTEGRNGSRGWAVLGTILRYELKMLARDTRTILIAVVTPLLLFPGFILVSNYVESAEERRIQEAEYRYAVTGSEAGWARDQVAAALALEARDPDTTLAAATFIEASAAQPDSALEAGDLQLVVEGLSPEEYRNTQDDGDSLDARAPVRALQLRYRAESAFSRAARDRIQDLLLEVRSERRDSLYQARGFPVSLDRVAVVEPTNVASAGKEAGAFLGLALTPFLVLLMLSGGSIVAVDAISGEKERGTLETLLTTAATRREIVRAKQLAVIGVGLAVALVNAANIGIYLGLGVLDLPASLDVDLGAGRFLLLLALFVPLAVLVSAALLLVSGYARSYKEYQIYFFPVFLAFLIPSAAAALPGLELRSAIAWVPVAGIAVAVREIMVGNVDLLFTTVAFLSTLAAGAWLALLTERTLSNERLISGAELDEADFKGGAALFPRHVLRWFLGFWVLFFVVSLWFGEALGTRGQILVNLVGIFFGGSAFLAWRYRLPLRETFSLRAPHPAAWLATLVGAPSALVVGIGFGEFVNRYLFPVPDQVIEAFGESLALPSMGLVQTLLFLAVAPGIFEEVAFRGALLHGLRKQMKPWMAVLVGGMVFGLFHVSLFRILPTALLGVILGTVVVLSGSIFPAILWHFLNNAMAVVPSMKGWLGPEFELPGWAVPAGLAGLALSFWLLARFRRPAGSPSASTDAESGVQRQAVMET